jgi:hypothetical protein
MSGEAAILQGLSRVFQEKAGEGRGQWTEEGGVKLGSMGWPWIAGDFSRRCSVAGCRKFLVLNHLCHLSWP